MSSKEAGKKINYSNYIVITEILFVLLPILVILIIDAGKGNYTALFDKPDMSFCSVLLSGQLIIKLVSVLLKTHENVRWQFIAFLITLIICFGLVPSLLFFVFMQNDKIELWVKIAQLVWFIGLIWIYFEIAGYAQEKEDKEDKEDKEV